jgi:heavy metal sensor kinase
MTIRLRLTLWYTALLGATLIFFSVLVYSALSANLNTQFVQDTANQANLVAQALKSQIERDISTLRRPALPDLDYFARSLGVQIVGIDGEVYARSSNITEFALPTNQQAIEAVQRGDNHIYYAPVRSPSNTNLSFLVYSVPLNVGDRVLGAVQIIKPPAEGAQNALNQVSRYLIFGTALSLMVASIVGALLARRTLAPIDEITRTASSITRAKDLGQRLEMPDSASEVGQLAATFNEMLDRIQALFHTQERLIADVSHELRTPLTTVQGNMDLLQRMLQNGGDPPKPETITLLLEILSEVENETTRMNNMIRDLLLLAQADSGVLQLQMNRVELDTLLLEVYRQARRIAERMKGANALDIRLGHEDQALVWGDRERLRQVLLNLVDNAIKYTPAGGAITLSLENKAGWVEIAVSDTGIGIRPEDQKLIFERFYRTDKARSRELGGSGLGLSIASWIAQAHNGMITVQSAPQQGSAFTLRLPEYVSPEAAPQKM